jgi:hypothetical protein
MKRRKLKGKYWMFLQWLGFDITPKIQKMIDKCLKTGEPVMFPPGKFEIKPGLRFYRKEENE